MSTTDRNVSTHSVAEAGPRGRGFSPCFAVRLRVSLRTLAQPTKLTPGHTIDDVSGNVVVFLIWCVLGLPIAAALTRHWQSVHRRWLLAVAEREAGTSLRTDGRLRPRRVYWELRASTRRGFGSRIHQRDANPDIEAMRQESVAAFREVRMRLALVLTLWLALGLAMLIALR